MSFDYTIHGKHCNSTIEIDCEISGIREGESIEILQISEVRLMNPCYTGDLNTITLSINDMTGRDERYWTAIANELLDTTPDYRVRETIGITAAQRRGEFDSGRDPIADRRGNWPVDKSIKTGCNGRCANNKTTTMKSGV